jgi:hypothetical protein
MENLIKYLRDWITFKINIEKKDLFDLEEEFNIHHVTENSISVIFPENDKLKELSEKEVHLRLSEKKLSEK